MCDQCRFYCFECWCDRVLMKYNKINIIKVICVPVWLSQTVFVVQRQLEVMISDLSPQVTSFVRHDVLQPDQYRERGRGGLTVSRAVGERAGWWQSCDLRRKMKSEAEEESHKGRADEDEQPSSCRRLKVSSAGVNVLLGETRRSNSSGCSGSGCLCQNVAGRTQTSWRCRSGLTVNTF